MRQEPTRFLPRLLCLDTTVIATTTKLLENSMKITVWSLTIDTKHGVSTDVHATEDAAWASLHSMFIGDELWNGQAWDDPANHLTVTNDTPTDVLSEWLTNGYNDVSFYGPDPTVIDVPDPTIEIIHQRDPDGECGFSYYFNGVRDTNAEHNIVQHDLDPGRGYDFKDWAGQAASSKQSASEAAWSNELASYYAEPCGDDIDGLPDDDNWLDHLDDNPDNRVWWTTNHPDVPLDYLF